ncbi:DUF5994 family protein [Mycolicibacterium xanthum]|uniref:DUF5994 family protein n=1 Tax=Mycolicibacterium xanthum TaxID=2796469 RepID=UPI0027E1DC6D|nr:DUF5994 family protein [Mycolicibacterium xanthum]
MRLTLARQSLGGIGGAWWPHSALIAAELPDLVGALHRQLGEILDIRINWTATEGQLDLETIVSGARVMRPDEGQRYPRLMAVTGRAGQANLLVVPSMTSQALGMMVMRTAAGMPTSRGVGDARVFETAQVVMRLAQAECAKWIDEAAVEEKLV